MITNDIVIKLASVALIITNWSSGLFVPKSNEDKPAVWLLLLVRKRI